MRCTRVIFLGICFPLLAFLNFEVLTAEKIARQNISIKSYLSMKIFLFISPFESDVIVVTEKFGKEQRLTKDSLSGISLYFFLIYDLYTPNIRVDIYWRICTVMTCCFIVI